jgi:8-amino-7-oxononanoate synthase
MTREEIEAGLAARLAAVTGTTPAGIERRAPFSELSIDSVGLVTLGAELEEWLGRRLAADVFWDYPTIESLAGFLIEELAHGAQRSSSAIPEEAYRFELFPEIADLRERLDLVQLSGRASPYFQEHEGVTNDRATIAGRDVINFSTYNYLGLSGHPAVSEAAKRAIDRYGTSVSASRVISGEKPVHRELERAVADLIGAEDCIVYVSGHATNVSTIGHLLGREDVVVADSLIHNSVVEGALRAGAARFTFPHNDWQALDDLLIQERGAYRRALVVLEGVYSMDGDIPNLPRFVEVKTRHRALLMIDEAHSIGVLGARGGGIREHFGLAAAEVDIWMGTLSKAFASCGGYIAGAHALIEYLKYTSPGFAYSVGMTPANAAAALAAVRVLQAEPDRVTRLHQRARYLLDGARRRGLDTGSSQGSPIVPVLIGATIPCLRLSQALFERGVCVPPLVAPVVEPNSARLRFFVSCLHTEEQIDRALDAVLAELVSMGRGPVTHPVSVIEPRPMPAPVVRAPAPVLSPRVSVLVPVYNRAELLAATLDGLIQQTLRDWEAIVVDDGSTDASLAVARRYASADARIRAIGQKNGGPSVARNRGVIEMSSTSEHVLFLDAGDVLLASSLVRLLATVEGQPDAAGAYGLCEWVNDGPPADAQPVDRCGAKRRGVKDGQIVCWPEDEPTTFAVVAVAGSGPVTPGQVLIRREALLAAGKWDPVLEHRADWDLWFRLTQRGPLAYLPETVVRVGARPTRAAPADDELLMFSAYVLFKRARDRHLTGEQRSALAVGMRDFGGLLGCSGPRGDAAQQAIQERFDDLAALALDADSSQERQRTVLEGLGALARDLAAQDAAGWQPFEEMVLLRRFGVEPSLPVA